MTFEDGVRLVAERGEAMHDAAEENPGTMAAVLGLEDDAAEDACSGLEGVWVANYNAPGQVVIAGTEQAVADASEVARKLGAKRVTALNVAGAFHTPLMEPASRRLRKALSSTRFLLPEVPVVANLDARAHRGAGEWRSLLSGQLTNPVRWRQCMQTLGSLGTTCVVEVGPGGVLTSLAKRAPGGHDPLGLGTRRHRRPGSAARRAPITSRPTSPLTRASTSSAPSVSSSPRRQASSRLNRFSKHLTPVAREPSHPTSGDRPPR